jgi:uncharacterized Rmd1/YagE family protein
MSKNRFAGLQAVKQLQDTKEIEVKETQHSKTFNQSPAQVDLRSNGSDDATAPRRGRPNGKRSNAEFQQVTAYVRRDTYRKVSIKLLDRENKGEFSALIEELLKKWIEE